MSVKIELFLNNKLTCVTMGNVSVYFSYETPVAVKYKGVLKAIRENVWGSTTGKHLNFINDDKSIRVGEEKFNTTLNNLHLI